MFPVSYLEDHCWASLHLCRGTGAISGCRTVSELSYVLPSATPVFNQELHRKSYRQIINYILRKRKMNNKQKF